MKETRKFVNVTGSTNRVCRWGRNGTGIETSAEEQKRIARGSMHSKRGATSSIIIPFLLP